jgi:hypothetical protein
VAPLERAALKRQSSVHGMRYLNPTAEQRGAGKPETFDSLGFTRRSAIKELSIVWSMCPHVFFMDTMNWINLPATCEQRILILPTRPTILRRPSIMLGV